MRTYAESDILERMTPGEMKAELVRMLVALADFCDAHGLRYCLSGGTLLGAVRHQGFIPWDDDIDVNMPRPDCERLMALSGGRIGPYELNPPNCDGEYHAYHWKLFDEAVLVRKKGGARAYPIFIDIFPIEGLPETTFGNWLHFLHVRFWKALADCLWKKKWFHGHSGLAMICHAAFRPVALVFGRRRLFDRVVRVMTALPFDDVTFVGVMATKVHTTEERVRKDDFMRVADVMFEGRRFHGPGNAAVYLAQLYGPHFMELPPVERRVSHGLAPHRSHFGARDRRDGRLCVAVCGLVKSANLGEMFIARSLERLIEAECRSRGYAGRISFVEVDLLGRNDVCYPVAGVLRERLVNYASYSLRGLPGDAAMTALKLLSQRVPMRFPKNACLCARHWIHRFARNYTPRLKRYLRSKLRGCDYIVVDGAGLLEYSFNEYQEPLLLVSELAEELRLEVAYNAIGRAGAFDECDFRSKIIKRALRSPCVRFVSARDSVETVQRCAGEAHAVELLADAAFCMREAFRPSPPATRTKVGIGLVRGNALLGYGEDFGTADWVVLFAGIAGELSARGYEFEFFTNGLQSDFKLGRVILEKMGLPDRYLVERPTDAAELYATIGGYRGVITCRMHSAIAAFTVGVPAVILSWNEKVEKLMATVGYPERAIRRTDFDPTGIVDRFERALAEGVDDAKVAVMREKARQSVRGYVDRILASAK